jgi:glycosyltransferase involved in cell wall biosynthesis
MANNPIQFRQDGNPMVTVALAVLNGGATLEHAVCSILNQSWPHWELLLLDDGSTDGAIEHLPFLSDPRIIVVRDGQHRGLASRLNQAVDMAQGKYFARMDHDDLCHPERFSRQIAFLDEHQEVDLLATRCVTMNEREQLIGALPSDITHADICRRPWWGFYMAHPSWMGRTEWFRRNCYQDPAPYRCEDQELVLRAHYSSQYHTLPEYLLAYRVHTRILWAQRFKTRMAMGKMKFAHFLARKELILALLSGLVEGTKLGIDVLNIVGAKLCLYDKDTQSSILTLENRKEWESIIISTKVSAERSKSKLTIDG